MPEFIASKTPVALAKHDGFTVGYFEAAEFTDCHSDSPDLNDAGGFSDSLIASSVADCQRFQTENADDLVLYEELTGRPMDHAGHDFWLTRNGHGAGFWDREGVDGTDKAAVIACLTRLDGAAQAFGQIDLYAGDDNMIYGA